MARARSASTNRLLVGRLQRIFIKPWVFSISAVSDSLGVVAHRRQPRRVSVGEDPVARIRCPTQYTERFPNVQAAIGLAALEQLDEWTAQAQANARLRERARSRTCPAFSRRMCRRTARTSTTSTAYSGPSSRASQRKRRSTPAIALPAREDGAVWRLGHAARVLRHRRTSTWRSARAPGCSTSATWARSRSPARTRWPRVQRISCNDASKLQVGAGAVFRAPDPAAAPSSTICSSTGSAPITSCSSSTPRTSSRTTPGSPSSINDAGDAVVVDASSRYALLAVQGPAAARRRAAADRASIWRDSSTTRSPTARSRTSARRSRGPATPARTGSRSSSRRSRPTASGRRFSRPASPPVSIPCGLGRARHAPARSRDAAVRQRHRRDDDARSRRASAGLSAGRRTTSSARRRFARRRPRRVTRSWSASSCVDPGIARHGLRRLRRRRHDSRHGHQRHADAVFEEGDRHGLPADRSTRRRAPSSRSTSAAGGRARASCRCRFTNAA